MKQQGYRRLLVLLVACTIVAMAWLYVATGCDGTSTTTPPSDRVRRRATTVWAGSPGNGPPLLTNGNWKNLYADNSVRTDQFGEAELQLDGCNGSVWVFDSSTLSVWTCTKQAEEEKEYWCTEEGTAGFNIDCTARFIVVDTPSAQAAIQSTAFTVTYLPDNQLTLVTVFRGVVEVAPVLEMGTLEVGEPVPVEEGFFLYTMPGELSPEVGEVPAREPRPLHELPIIVYDLGIRGWMDDITRWGYGQQILTPTWPFEPEPVTLVPPETLTPTLTPTSTPTPETPTPTLTPTSTPTPETPTPTLTPTSTPTPGPPPECIFDAEGEFATLWQTYKDQLGCPLYPTPKAIQDAEQAFDNGHMFWREDNKHVYVVYEKGAPSGTYQAFLDEWEEGDPQYSCAGTPPVDRVQPERGFGVVWCTLGGPAAAIGWGLEEEAGFWSGKGDPLVHDFGSGVIFRDSAGTTTGMAYVLMSNTGTFVHVTY